MRNKFTNRSYQKEIMDDLEVDGPVLSQTLKELRTINKLLGGNYVTTNGLAKIMKQNPQPSYLIADIGCGGGDMIRVMADWAKKTKNYCQFIGIDANDNTIEMEKPIYGIFQRPVLKPKIFLIPDFQMKKST